MSSIAAAQQFLGMLDPRGLFDFVTFADSPDDRSLTRHLRGGFSEHLPELVALNDAGAGIFVTINETDSTGRCAKNVTRVRAVFVDLDGADLSPVESWELAPHIVVESSPGRWHAYWLVHDLATVDFSGVQRSLASRFAGDRCIIDLPRVMRMPGFHHCKGEPTPVVIKSIRPEMAAYDAKQLFKALGIDGHGDAQDKSMRNPILTGERNSTLTKIGGKLRRFGHDETDIKEELRRISEDRCVPPLDYAEVATIAASVARYPTELVPSGFITSDTGNAQRFVEQHGYDMKYVPQRGKWLVWDDSHWTEDASGQVIERAKETAKSLFSDAVDSTSDVARSALAKHAAQSLNQGRLNAMVKLATTDRAVVVDVAKLDADDFLMGVQNGVINLRDGSFRKSRREDLLTLRSNVAYDLGAECPTFSQFIDRVTGGEIDLQGYLQRLVGYALTGNTREQCFAFLYGHGANGKSTFLEVVMKLCGDYATQTQPETLMARRGGGASSDLARLVGKRLVVSNEVREGAQLEENLLKQMVGGDLVTARFLYQEHFEFYPKFKLIIAGNHQPIIKGDDHGIWRRVHLVPFVQTIPEKERDKDLGGKLAKELPGILNWAIKGCLAWQKDGLRAPAIISEATKAYREEMDIMGQWLGQECTVGTGHRCSSRQLYDNYRKWCEFCSVKPVSSMVFIRKLETRGFRREHTRTGNLLIGIGLRPIGLALVA